MTADLPAEKAAPRLVVGVGASAGGLEAFKKLLSAFSDRTGMAFLLVQHLDPTHESLLTELLTPCTAMAVRDADQGVELRPDTVYVIRPDTALGVRNGTIELSEPTLHRGVRLPVDHLFRSLARHYGPRAAGIVLSGAGSDGSAGLRVIKGAGGLAVAQDPSTGGQPGMPQSAIDTGVVDLVLEIEQMPAALERFASLPSGARIEPCVEERVEPLSSLSEYELGRLGALVQAQLNFDLSVYKPATVERRILRRMALSGFDDVATYLEHLRQDQTEQQNLVRDLLISVTDFFRDREAFRALRELVIDPLATRVGHGDAIRVWVPGCATGEEAYSIGIEVLEALKARDKAVSVQIFATDVDEDALAFGRVGIYPPSIAERLGSQRLEGYFRPLDGKGYQVRPQLRDVLSFSTHDLTKDPPFSRMDLVSCRNVLIYLTTEAQKHVLKVFHFGLVPEGHLFLGTSESVGPQRNLFATLSKSKGVFRKMGASRPIAAARSRFRPLADREGGLPSPTTPTRRMGRVRAGGGDLARRTVLEAWVPPTVIVSEDNAVLFMHGELGPYLRFPQGENPRLELSSLLRPDLATRCRGALYNCRKSNDEVVVMSSPDMSQGNRIRISAKPALALGHHAVMLTFEQVQRASAEDLEDTDSPGSEAIIGQLESELRATREDLRSTVEELETSNEELRSSNEESMSMNEELQSANEELEATAEELRSLNEELTTVNAQLREKVEQLEEAHDDLQNFFSSTKIATIFLDERSCIKRFTPAAGELLDIDHADKGRHTASIAREALQFNLQAEVKAVLNDFAVRSSELRTRDGRWLARQVLPYRTENRRIEGVVVTFNDVTELRSANDDLAAKSRRLELAWEVAGGGVYEHRVPPDETTYFSEQWAQVFGYRRQELPSFPEILSWVDECVHPDDRDAVERSRRDFIEGRSVRHRAEVRMRHRNGDWIWVRQIADAVTRNEEGRVLRVLGMTIDITETKRVEESLRESESRFREMTDGLPLLVWLHDASGQRELVNATYRAFFGLGSADADGGRWEDVLHPDDAEAYLSRFYGCLRRRESFLAEARMRRGDGAWRWVESWGLPRFTAEGQYRGFVGTSVDITERKSIERVLHEREERVRIAEDAAAFGIYDLDVVRNSVHADARLRELWGFGPTEAISFEAFFEGFLPEDRPATRRALDRALDPAGEGRFEAEYRIQNRVDGEIRWVLATGAVSFEADRPKRIVGTVLDVTDIKSSQEALQEAARQKDEFLAMLGHELRNPLAVIRSAAELIKLESHEDDRLRRAQAMLERQAAHMAKLLDGLLDVSRIIRGKIKLDMEVADLAAVCQEVLQNVAERTRGRHLDIQTEWSPDPVWIEADRVRLMQIVENVVSNAVQYTADGGSILLKIVTMGDDVVLRVRDTGVGIESDLLPHIFEPFRQSAQSLERGHGGLGLGLSLVKTLTELHGGEVEAHSEGEGRGAEFVLRLPLTSKRVEVASRSKMTRERLRILIIEDNEDAAELLQRLLEFEGHEVLVTFSGREGIRLAKENPPDAVLCDLGLPGGLNGFDVAETLRADPSLGAVRLVALSGYGRPEDKARGQRSGFDAHLTKPVDIEALKDFLAGQE